MVPREQNDFHGLLLNTLQVFETCFVCVCVCVSEMTLRLSHCLTYITASKDWIFCNITHVFEEHNDSIFKAVE
jgi:hypothetical protein